MTSFKLQRKIRFGKGIGGIASLLPGPNAVKVGFPSGAAGSSVIERAVYNEFGTRGGASGGGWGGPIPERPFMRNAMKNTGKLDAELKKQGKAVIWAAVKGQNTASIKRQALRKVGIEGKNLIQSEITSLASPPNSPVTIALKGSSNPLIDTGEMRGAVTWKIEE